MTGHDDPCTVRRENVAPPSRRMGQYLGHLDGNARRTHAEESRHRYYS